MSCFERIVHSVSKNINWLACIAIAGMMVVVCFNIISRLFGKPILGTFETTGMLAAVATAFAIAYTQIQRGHSTVGILTTRLSRRTHSILICITRPVLIGLSVVATWQCVLYANSLWLSGEVTQTLHYPSYPYVFAIAFCFAVLTLVFLVEFLESLVRLVKK